MDYFKCQIFYSDDVPNTIEYCFSKDSLPKFNRNDYERKTKTLTAKRGARCNEYKEEFIDISLFKIDNTVSAVCHILPNKHTF